MRRFLIASALTLSLALPAAAQDAKPAAPNAARLPKAVAGAPASEADKTLYALGLVISRNLAGFKLSAAELAVVEQGMADGVLGRTPKVDLETYGPKLNDFAKSRIAAARRGREEGRRRVPREGGRPARREEAALRLRLSRRRRRVRARARSPPTRSRSTTRARSSTGPSSTAHRGQRPRTFPLNQVIPCWTQGVQLMKEGGSARLVCPSELAYGDDGRPPRIKGGATLVFDVQLLSIEKNAPPAAAAPPEEVTFPGAQNVSAVNRRRRTDPADFQLSSGRPARRQACPRRRPAVPLRAPPRPAAGRSPTAFPSRRRLRGPRRRLRRKREISSKVERTEICGVCRGSSRAVAGGTRGSWSSACTACCSTSV